VVRVEIETGSRGCRTGPSGVALIFMGSFHSEAATIAFQAMVCAWRAPANPLMLGTFGRSTALSPNYKSTGVACITDASCEE
jgi:hypothetical protein